jgi:hypothetical protein
LHLWILLKLPYLSQPSWASIHFFLHWTWVNFALRYRSICSLRAIWSVFLLFCIHFSQQNSSYMSMYQLDINVQSRLNVAEMWAIWFPGGSWSVLLFCFLKFYWNSVSISNFNFTFQLGQGSLGTSIICPQDLSLYHIH